MKLDIPQINNPDIKIDPAPFAAVHAQAVATKESGNKAILTGDLAVIKIRTICAPLTAEDRQTATEIVRELVANGWLSESDSTWCQKQGIPVL